MPFETIADFVANKRRGRVFNKWTEYNGATLIALLRAYFDSYNASYDPVDHLNVDTILNVTEERNRPGKLSKLRQIEDIDSRLAYHLGELKSRKFDFRPALGRSLRVALSCPLLMRFSTTSLCRTTRRRRPPSRAAARPLPRLPRRARRHRPRPCQNPPLVPRLPWTPR